MDKLPQSVPDNQADNATIKTRHKLTGIKIFGGSQITDAVRAEAIILRRQRSERQQTSVSPARAKESTYPWLAFKPIR
jgi:hypothetical protein